MKLKFNLNAATKKQTSKSPNIKCFDNLERYNDQVHVSIDKTNVTDCTGDHEMLEKITYAKDISSTTLGYIDSQKDSFLSESCDEKEDFNINLEMSTPLNSQIVTSHSDIKIEIHQEVMSEISKLQDLKLQPTENSTSNAVNSSLIGNVRSESLSDNMAPSILKSIIPKSRINLSKAISKRTPKTISTEHISTNETQFFLNNLDTENKSCKMNSDDLSQICEASKQELYKEETVVVLETADLEDRHCCDIDTFTKTIVTYPKVSPIQKSKINLDKAISKNLPKTSIQSSSIDRQSMVSSDFVEEKEYFSQKPTESLADIPGPSQASESPGCAVVNESVPVITKSRINLSKAVSKKATTILIPASPESNAANCHLVSGCNERKSAESNLNILNAVDKNNVAVTMDSVMESCDDDSTTRSEPITEVTSVSDHASVVIKSRINLNKTIGKTTPKNLGKAPNLETSNEICLDQSGSKIITGGDNGATLSIYREPEVGISQSPAALGTETSTSITEKVHGSDSIVRKQSNKGKLVCEEEKSALGTMDPGQLLNRNFATESPRMGGPMKSKLNVKNATCKDQFKTTALISNAVPTNQNGIAKSPAYKSHNIQPSAATDVSNDNSSLESSTFFTKERVQTRKRLKSDSLDQWDQRSMKSDFSTNESMTSSRRRNAFVLKHHKSIVTQKSSICDESIRLKDLINSEAYMPPPKKRGTIKSKPTAIKEPKLNSESESDQPDYSVTKFRIDLDGRIVVDDCADDRGNQSFNREGMELVIEDANDLKATYKSYTKRRLSGRRWSEEETRIYYQALMMVGTNFTAMATIFSTRSREDLKKKYKVEEKRNPKIIDHILQNPRPWNVTSLKLEVPVPDLSQKKRKSRHDVVKRNWRDSPESDEEITPRKKNRRFVPDALKLDETAQDIPDYLKSIQSFN